MPRQISMLALLKGDYSHSVVGQINVLKVTNYLNTLCAKMGHYMCGHTSARQFEGLGPGLNL
jgi:hypothetical protein